jgi:hypothetical protein
MSERADRPPSDAEPERIDRRGVFFALAALVCLALAPIADEFAWVCMSLTVIYVLLAVGSFLDARTRARLKEPRGQEAPPR